MHSSLSAMSVSGNWCSVLFFLIFSTPFSCLVDAQSFDYPTANLSTSWTNGPSASHSVAFTDGSKVRAILLRGTFGPRYACGFFCNGTCDSYLFAVFIVQTNSVSNIVSPAFGFPHVVWSANRNNPVRINATLELTSDGNLVLQDADGAIAWSTNTSGKSVVGLNLTDMGNLVLFDKNKAAVWQSFDHPTDSLVPGQKLLEGKKLTASVSTTNWTDGGLLSLSVTNEGLFAFIESNNTSVPYYKLLRASKTSKEPSHARYLNRSLALFINTSEPREPDGEVSLHPALLFPGQYMRLWPDGHLRVYEWQQYDGWTVVGDLLTGIFGECGYPLVCGKYSICSRGQCSCPATYFKPLNERQLALGCSQITPLSCEASQDHSFVELNDVTYFAFSSFSSDLTNTDPETCKQACLNNCSCKAALFQRGLNSSAGDCYLPSEIFSMMNNEKERTHYNSTAYIKVQNLPVPGASPEGKETSHRKRIMGFILGSFFGLLVLIGILIFFFRKKKGADEIEEDCLDQVPGLPKRFSFEELKVMTDNFRKILGKGGFGSVFEGTQTDGTKVAVKRLEGIGEINKSFLAEVKTIGSIHHLNLLRLIGFCTEKSHNLLVYEYMPNGSLDRWLFQRSDEFMLDWQQRKKIILDIAKGLTYLHEDCRQKILHLDIKPQNILLDDNFNAKVADFGLSKLIDRDQSQVVTTMRGTPGYLAPEWLSSVITEKVDIYSFGVVMLEILCGRKVFDRSQPEEEDMYLLSIFNKKAEEDKLSDLVDKHSNDMQSNEEEVVNMMKVSAWCLESDFVKRPSMSMVVKISGRNKKRVPTTLNFCQAKLSEEVQSYGKLTQAFTSGSSTLRMSVFRHCECLKNPLTLMSYVAPIMALVTALLSLLLDPWHEFKRNNYFNNSWHVTRSLLLMLSGGALAFFMVSTEFVLVSVTSAVTVQIAAVVKEAVNILVAVFYFHDEFTWLKGFGLFTILVGVSLFNWYKFANILVVSFNLFCERYQKLQAGHANEDSMLGSRETNASAKYFILEEIDDLDEGT
ncbi:Receptor-like serine/threonine-protein kinase [Citrus sinensis]|uniref:Receptor-like serine/threonine-protein kinase n=1 Tax=Citrus sinensis TaxID=2711 RepID=A0ACB8N8W9_CITSI|nr:Receptor-like serine/threonine-protein kinase [Citrus sinensis]